MLSSSLVLGVYLTVQNLQKPSLYLRIKPKRERERIGDVRTRDAGPRLPDSHVALQRPICGHQDVEAQVKFLSSYQQRVVDVQGDDVGLFAARSCYKPEIPHVANAFARSQMSDDARRVFTDSRGGAAVSGPLFDLGQFVDEEDAFALGLAAGLHDPGAGRVLAELLHKEVIVGGEHEGHRNEIWRREETSGTPPPRHPPQPPQRRT